MPISNNQYRIDLLIEDTGANQLREHMIKPVLEHRLAGVNIKIIEIMYFSKVEPNVKVLKEPKPCQKENKSE